MEKDEDSVCALVVEKKRRKVLVWFFSVAERSKKKGMIEKWICTFYFSVCYWFTAVIAAVFLLGRDFFWMILTFGKCGVFTHC